MSLVTTEAILLRAYPYSESSRVLRFLTRERGVVSLMGRGVRSTRRGKGGAALESFAEGVLTFRHRADRDLHTLGGFERTSGPLPLGGAPIRLAGASFVAELLLAHALEEPDPELYDWIRTALAGIGAAPDGAVPGWILSAAWRTLGLLGFDPELDRCLSCGGEGPWEEADDEVCRFDAASGGILCPACARGTEFPRLGPRAREDLRALARGEPRPVPPEWIPGHLRILETFALHHLAVHREFQSLAVLRRILAPREGA